jgi:hypothetical protein
MGTEDVIPGLISLTKSGSDAPARLSMGKGSPCLAIPVAVAREKLIISIIEANAMIPGPSKLQIRFE